MEFWPGGVVEGWLAKEVVALTRLCPRSVAICMFARCVRSIQGNDMALKLAGMHQQPHAAFQCGTTEPHAPDAGVIIRTHRLGSSTVDALLNHLVQAGQRPGEGVGVGGGLGRGAGCRKVAAVQAGAQAAILHLQRYAYMQVGALGLCQTPPGCHADCIGALSIRSCQLFSTSGSHAMVPVGVVSGLYQLTHIRSPQATRCQEVQQWGHGIRMQRQDGGQACTW